MSPGGGGLVQAVGPQCVQELQGQGGRQQADERGRHASCGPGGWPEYACLTLPACLPACLPILLQWTVCYVITN
jgi:hypothetical protein